uniref:ANK_REP_REGION domain-containing protein n=1 Tax=Anopheles christyi TaxID=43041 RepID=A0A182K5A3_9DIPT
MEDVNLMESVFEAISAGDADLLEGCTQQMTIESVLEFERLYVVRRLLASGLFDSAGADGDGRTMLEVAYEGEDSELLEALIKVTTEEMDDATACYSMLRHDSLAIFKSFLAVKQFMEEQEFQHIASALIQLNAKNVHLSEDLYIYALWKLSDYGFRNLSGNWPGTKDPNEWKHHVEIVQECWEDIAAHHDTGLYADIDDQFLQRTQTLHNSLYFLKHKQFLAYLPMQEAIFCVAIFLSIYRNAAQFQEYRLMINKCLVIEFMRMISRQLTLVKTYLERTETDLLEIVREVETKDATAKGSLMGDLLAKIESSQLPNKEHVVKQLKERVSTIGSSNKDSLIKDMMDKLKRIDKRWVEQKMEELKALEKVSKEHLIEQIGKRLRHVSHPQNVANRLMGDWKKGKATEPIVADIISGESFDLSHLLQQDRRTKRKLLKCYSATKQHYSLHKIMYYLERMASTAKRNVTTPTTHVDIACMKRTVQVLGEAIKNTTNSANMPGKAEAAVHSMLTSLFPDMNKQLREVFSHSISLKKLLIGDGNDRRLCNTFRSHLGMVRTAFQLLYVVSVAEIRHAFYGFMRRCRSLRELRSLALYVGDMEELEERQLACYQQVQVYFEEAKDTFAELEQEPIGQRPQFRHLQKELEVKRSIVSDLGRHFDENAAFSYGELRRACLSGDSLDAIRKVLDWKLTMTWANKFFKKVRASWHSNHVESVTMEWIDNRLLAYNPSVIAGILKNSSISMDCAEEFDYIANTREIVKDFAVQGEDTIGEEALQQLNKRLKPYYNNIFFVDNKWKVLEAFCKERKLPWNKERSRELVKRDQAHLQQLYDERRAQLRSILEQNGINTLDGLTKRLFALPTSMLVAIEYIQLELCEMLYAVGYFGDSFHYVKHLIPMIQGKNYRNFLAHDALSYNLLTDSSMEKIVINAFVLANRVVRLFGGGNGAKAVHLTFPTLRETIAWAKRQTQLLKAFQAGDIKQMHCLVKSGGEIKKARFCCTRNPTYLAADYFGLSALVNPDRADKSMVEYLSRYFAGFHDRCNDPAYQLEMALKLRDFQAVFDRTIGTGDRVIREELLDWPELMKRVRKTDLFVHLIAAVNRGNILKKLIEHGNEQGVREMLPYFEQFNVSENRGPLGDAMLYCVRSITDLLLHRTTVPHPAIILLAIILHWNDIFIVMMNKSDIDQATYQFVLKTAAQARNYTAGVYLLETPTLARFIPAAFEQCCLSAVRAGEVNLLKHLLVRCPGENMISLAKILHEAAVRKRWKCVEVLLREENAPIDALFRDGLKEESCTFLLLVKYGQYHLLRNIVTIEREIFGTLATHPFTVAIRNGMASERMIRTLQRLGFDWLDSSSILHEAIHSKNRSIFETILKRVDVVCSLQPATHHDHFQLALSVLYRWKMIAFVEESKTYETSLFRAVQNKDYTMVEQLLSWARRARTMSAGALGGIVFERDSVYICSGKRSAEQPLWNTGDSCEEMVVCMETCALLEDMKWQQFTVQAQAIPITFHVLTVEEEILEPMSEDDATFTLSKPDSLLDCLKDILAFVNSKLTQCAIVFASFCTASGMKHFWQIEQTNCMYDVLSLADDNHHSDLSDTVNYRDMRGETPLHHCFPNDTLELVKLLVENGANPLLADHSGMAALHVSLLNSQDYAVGRYLFDQCVARDLRNEKGCSVLELDDGNGANRLIHTAVMVGRRDIIARLLQHGIDVSVVNSYGVTPALLAAGTNVYQSYRIVGMILEHDAGTIDAIDAKGQTLVQYAARVNSIELLRVVLQYKPNLLLASDSLTALGMAILLSHVEFAKCLLSYAREHDIRGLTRFGEEDLVVLSLICNDQELSRGLLEYELGHTLTEVDERDLPRLRSVLDCSLPGMEDVSVARVIERKGLTESANFLEELLVLVTSIADQ